MHSSPKQSQTLTLEQIESAIEQAYELSLPQVLVFTGDEATLLGDDLLEAIAFASSLGVSTRLVTNAQWAEEFARAQATVYDLRSSGLDELDISWDCFHAE